MNIEKQLTKNNDMLMEIENISRKISVSSDNRRDMLFAGLYRTALSHYCAIAILTEKGVYLSAFALVRVFFDSIVRALYLYHEFDEVKINKMYAGEADFPKIKIMCQKLDHQYEISFFDDIRERTYGVMCDYTHTGSNQVARNFNEAKNTIESNFSETLILDILRGTCTLVRILALDYFQNIGLNQKEINVEEVEVFFSKTDLILRKR